MGEGAEKSLQARISEAEDSVKETEKWRDQGKRRADSARREVEDAAEHVARLKADDADQDELAKAQREEEQAREAYQRRVEILEDLRKRVDLKLERLDNLREELERREETKGATVMYDSVDVTRIPKDAPAVAGYVNGIFTTWPKIVAGWPKAEKLSIAVTSSADAMCLDIEPGNADPGDAPGWVKRQKARGVKRPVVYANVSTMPAVLAALGRAGIDRSEVRVWTAHYDKGKHICGPQCGFGMKTEADGTQWTEDKSRNLDINELKPTFFG